ncbi:MAG: 50S ribosomal protein L3 [Candidatus Niyogibacteria bacterium]|nr:50S ribosomal protein L3 [Candidatus Niyogibacteria bacterium]
MAFILGTKLEMSQIFAEDGTVTPVTLIEAGPLVVTQVKTKAIDGYDAVQVGFGAKKEKNVKKPQRGHFKDLGNFRFVREFRTGIAGLELGATIAADTFKEGDMVRVSGDAKGRGFQGVVKRHGFGGGRRTHGQKHSEREPGSIGGGLRTHVPKGMRMAGRMGGKRVSVRNLKIVAIDKDNNMIAVLGAVPGRRGTLLEILS